ncbi:MAG: murein L,D-transpeptidase family protein [Verrucomicrobiota bacterium]
MRVFLSLSSSLLCLLMSASAGDIYPGGSSPVSSRASDRASQAAQRVTPILNRELASIGCQVGAPLFIRVFKETSELEVWLQPDASSSFVHFRTYRIAAHSGKLGPKTKQGDFQAPEGFYFVTQRGLNPHSSYHLSFNLGYPNAYDRAHGRTGDFLMVHGKNVSIGCYAMTDDSIEQIYTLASAALRQGQNYFRVHCFPFRFGKERMTAAETSPWFAFWKNLEEGYDAFEQTRVPPNIIVRNKRYVIDS